MENEIKEIEKIKLDEGDVLVVKIESANLPPRRMQDQLNGWYSNLFKIFPNNKVIVTTTSTEFVKIEGKNIKV